MAKREQSGSRGKLALFVPGGYLRFYEAKIVQTRRRGKFTPFCRGRDNISLRFFKTLAEGGGTYAQREYQRFVRKAKAGGGMLRKRVLAIRKNSGGIFIFRKGATYCIILSIRKNTCR